MKIVKITNILTDLAAFTGENVLKKKFYKTNSCYVHQDLVDSLNTIQLTLKDIGLQLCIIDAYRPLSVQKEIFQMINCDTRYVSDPNHSRHPKGTAVDVTLCDLNGNKLEMPTGFSDFGEKCHAFAECNANAKKNRDLLQKVMTDNNFQIYEYEWWHFDFIGWNNDEKYPPMDFEI